MAVKTTVDRVTMADWEAALEPRAVTRRAERPSAAIGYVWGLLRILLGWTFLWAFVDKVFGLGFATASEDAWINGGSPTFGYLTFATKGPLAEVFQGLAGNPVVDWVFMLGLLGVGVALTLGIGVRIASLSGATMLLLMYAATAIVPEHNPFLDEHIIYAVVLAGLALAHSGQYLGLGGWWRRTALVSRYQILE